MKLTKDLRAQIQLTQCLVCSGSELGTPMCIISFDCHSILISHVRKLRLKIFSWFMVEGKGHRASKWDSAPGSEAKPNTAAALSPQHHTSVETILRNRSNSFLSRAINIRRQGDETRKQTSFPRIWEQFLAKLPKVFSVLKAKHCQCR